MRNVRSTWYAAERPSHRPYAFDPGPLGQPVRPGGTANSPVAWAAGAGLAHVGALGSGAGPVFRPSGRSVRCFCRSRHLRRRTPRHTTDHALASLMRVRPASWGGQAPAALGSHGQVRRGAASPARSIRMLWSRPSPKSQASRIVPAAVRQGASAWARRRSGRSGGGRSGSCGLAFLRRFGVCHSGDMIRGRQRSGDGQRREARARLAARHQPAFAAWAPPAHRQRAADIVSQGRLGHTPPTAKAIFHAAHFPNPSGAGAVRYRRPKATLPRICIHGRTWRRTSALSLKPERPTLPQAYHRGLRPDAGNHP